MPPRDNADYALCDFSAPFDGICGGFAPKPKELSNDENHDDNRDDNHAEATKEPITEEDLTYQWYLNRIAETPLSDDEEQNEARAKAIQQIEACIRADPELKGRKVTELRNLDEGTPDVLSIFCHFNIWDFISDEEDCDIIDKTGDNKVKSTRFFRAKDPVIHEIPNRNDLLPHERANMWYTGKNIKDMRETRFQTAEIFEGAIEAGHKEYNGVSLRGCERYTAQGFLRFKERRARLNKKLKEMKNMNESELNAFFEKHTKGSREQALNNGRMDANIARLA